ncbi:hypothetical protein RJZ90_002924 [Blastomyces dermatitidis]
MFVRAPLMQLAALGSRKVLKLVEAVTRILFGGSPRILSKNSNLYKLLKKRMFKTVVDNGYWEHRSFGSVEHEVGQLYGPKPWVVWENPSRHVEL